MNLRRRLARDEFPFAASTKHQHWRAFQSTFALKTAPNGDLANNLRARRYPILALLLGDKGTLEAKQKGWDEG
jgi:hypothetical protein